MLTTPLIHFSILGKTTQRLVRRPKILDTSTEELDNFCSQLACEKMHLQKHILDDKFLLAAHWSIYSECQIFYKILFSRKCISSSGLLVTLLFLRSTEKPSDKKPSVASDAKKTFLLFLYRYIRLTPAYFVALLISEVSFK